MALFKRREDEETVGFQMSPMIDVVFQLLVFFMCVTQIRNLEIDETIKIPIASEALERDEMPGQLIMNVRKDGIVVINEEEFTPIDLAKVLINTVDETKKKYPLFIRADKNVKFGHVVNVLKASAMAGLWDVSFAAYKEEPGE